MAILNNSNAISSGGYDINNSLRFRNSASAYLSRTPASAPTDGKKLTLSCWVKRGILTGNYYIMQSGAGVGNDNYSSFYFKSDNTIQIGMYSVTPRVTTQVFRDASAWYHLVLAYDTTQATASDRVKLYVNGTQVTAFTTNGTIPQNTLIAFTKQSQAVYIGTASDEATYLDGYMTEVNLIDGQTLTPSSFGETDTTTGSWKPKAYSGTYGTNGFYLKFSDIATTSGSNAGLGKDFSGNANYWNTNNISVTAGTTYDAMTDVPTLTSATVANYCVMNQLAKQSGVTLANANLNVTTTGSSGSGTVNGTFGVSSGKWYWETTLNAATDATIFGIDEITELPGYPGQSSTSYSYYPVSALKINNTTQTSYGVTATTNDVIGCALDMDNGKIWWSKNGTWMASGDPVAGTNAAFTGITGTKTPAVGDGSSGSNVNVEYNFGQRPFAYTPPTGFVALNTYNLPTPTILQGNKYMDATTYSGTGSSQTIVNAGGFKPDFVWMKTRNVSANSNLVDSVRGTSALLQSNTTGAEATNNNTLSSFNSNGFTVVNDYGSNYAGNTYVGWQWQAGQGSSSSNTNGSITSTVSVNTTAGFSIVTYTGTGSNATVGHGLGVAPKMIIIKSRSAVANWPVYHSSLPSAAYYLRLDLTNAQANTANLWNSTAPTSSVFSLGNDSTPNTNGATYVAYCWAEIAGFSKFTSYTGNGSADGPFVYCNFRPKFVMIKRTVNAGGSWAIYDSARNTYNVANLSLYPNLTSGDDTYDVLDFTSNGFKIRTSSLGVNQSGDTFIVAAFAENPFKNSLAR